MPRYYVPIHFTKTRSARFKAQLDTFTPYSIVAVEAPSAIAAARLVAARIKPKDTREVSLRSPGNNLTPEAWKRWFLARRRELAPLKPPSRFDSLYHVPTDNEAWTEWTRSIERNGIWKQENK